MEDLERYLGRLILRELDYFRDNATTRAGQDATEVAQLDDSPPQLTTGQDTAAANTTAPSLAGTDGGHNNQQPKSQHMEITAMLDAEEEATGPQGTPARLMPFASTTARQRKNNAARQQRIYRLAHKLGVMPGGRRYVRGGRAYLQAAVPRSAVRADGWTVEYNQFMYDGHDASGDKVVVLRMPGGWRRGLVRDRPQFLGVAVVDGFLWPRFARGMPRSMLADWGKFGPPTDSPSPFPPMFSGRMGADSFVRAGRGAGLRRVQRGPVHHPVRSSRAEAAGELGGGRHPHKAGRVGSWRKGLSWPVFLEALVLAQESIRANAWGS